MKNTLYFVSAIAGLALVGCNKSTRTSTDSTTPPASNSAASTSPSSTDTVGARADQAGSRVTDATRNMADTVREGSREAAASMRMAGRDISARMTEWRLSASDIQADVAANRPIVRTRTDVATPSTTFDKGTLEKAIKGRLTADPQLANLKFDVDVSKQGEVELEGKVRTADQIAQAIGVVLSQDGVSKVTSKIKLDPDAGSRR